MVEHVSAVVRGDASPQRTAADAIEVATLIDRLRVVAEGGA